MKKLRFVKSIFCKNSQRQPSQNLSLSEQVSDRYLPVLTVNPAVLSPFWVFWQIFACSDRKSAVLTPFWHKNRPFWQIACQNGLILCQNAVLTLLAQTDVVSVLTNRRSVKTPFWQNLIAKSQVQRPSERRSDTVLRCQNSQVGCQDRGVLTTLTLSWHS